MPFGGFAPPPVGGNISVVVEGIEIRTFVRLRFTQHFLTPTDTFSFDLSTEDLTGELLDAILVPGNRVEIFIGDAKQFTGYIDVVDTTNVDRSTGSYVSIEGRDTMSPVVDSQIDPDKHYPDKTPLDVFLAEVLGPWFQKFDVENDANVEVAANLALKQKRRAGTHHRRRKPSPKPLKQYPLPKSKPEHNDSYWQFCSRILNRLGLWMWPSVDGDTCIVGKPNYDQDPLGSLWRKRLESSAAEPGATPSAAIAPRLTSNIQRGGVRRDATEQPSFIVARGAIPPKAHEHQKLRVVVANPYSVDLPIDDKVSAATASVLGLLANDDSNITQLVGGAPGRLQNQQQLAELSKSGEAGTFNSLLARYSTQVEKWTTYTKADPVEISNPFAAKAARPRFIRDRNSRSPEELERFAKRQMSLCTRKAFVATYTFAGLTLAGIIPVVDSVLNVDDDLSMFVGNLWVLGKDINASRQGGATTTLTCVPLGSLQF